MKINQISINPDSPRQARIFYDINEGPAEHPQKAIDTAAQDSGFKVIGWLPQTIADGWDVWIEFDVAPDLPDYFRCSVPWKPIGQA